jgi:hypothetical protein
MTDRPLDGDLVVAPYDDDEIARELLACDGQVRKVARKLKLDSQDLRLYVGKSARLAQVMEECFALAVDEAMEVLYAGLRDDGSFQNRFYSAKEFLRSSEGRKRGFGAELSGQAMLELKGDPGRKTITLRWLDPLEEPPKLAP